MYPDNNASVYLASIVKEYIDQHQISCMDCPAQREDLLKDLKCVAETKN